MISVLHKLRKLISAILMKINRMMETTYRGYSFEGFLFVIILTAIHLRLYQYAFDDAYIHLRIARNFIDYGVPYYNLNEIVKVGTSSGWIIVLTIITAFSRLFGLGGSILLLVSIFNVLSVLGGLVIYTKIVRNLSGIPPSRLMIFLFQISYTALVTPSSVGLMEVPFALFLAGVGIYHLLSWNRDGFAILGIASYIRLELIVLIIIAMMFITLSKKIKEWEIFAYSSLGVAPFIVYDLYFYNTFTPHSITAKSIIYSISAIHTLGYILFFSIPTLPYLLIGGGILFVGSISFSFVVGFSEWRNSRNYWIIFFLLWGIIIILGYIVGHAFMFDWYTPLYSIPILVSCFLCGNVINRLQRNFARGILYLLFLSLSVFLLLTLYSGMWNPGTFVNFESGSRVKTYLRVGEILNKEYPHAILLAPEIGGLGYTFQGRILDAVGLASPESLKFHPMKVPEEREFGDIGAIPPALVRQTMPDVIVSLDTFAQALLRDQITSQYRIIQIPAYLPNDEKYSKNKTIWGNRYLRIYIRRDLSISQKILDMQKD